MTVTPIYISNQEIINLPAVAQSVGDNEIVLGVWSHEFDAAALSQLYGRCRVTEAADNRVRPCVKRRIDQLSVGLMVCKMMNEVLRVEHEVSGRPYLKNKEIEISISHTKQIFALSFANFRHGIDIEHCGVKALKVCSKFLTSTELLLLSSMSAVGSKETIATLLWSAKEAAYKCFDLPGLSLLSDIQLSQCTPGYLSATLPNHGHAAIIRYILKPNYVLTVCKAMPSDKK